MIKLTELKADIRNVEKGINSSRSWPYIEYVFDVSMLNWSYVMNILEGFICLLIVLSSFDFSCLFYLFCSLFQ